MRGVRRVLGILAGLSLIAAPAIVALSVHAGSEEPAQTAPEAKVSLPDPNAPGDPVRQKGTIAVGAGPESAVHGTNVRAAGGPGTGTQSEISLASSGPSIVITFNGGPSGSGFVTSVDGGLTFSPNASFPGPAGSNACCDPGVVADLLGRFYFVQIYRDDGANTPMPGNCTNSVHVSNDGGQTWSGIVGSPFSYMPGTTDFPDQPHMGIDRLNLIGGQPQLYVFTRHFINGINCPQTGGGGQVQGEVTCSTDGGANWIAPIVLGTFTDLAHWATGSDGSAYLVGNGIDSAPAGTCQATGVCTNGSYANCINPMTMMPQDNRCDLTRILLYRSTQDCNTGLSFGAPAVVASALTFSGVGVDREFVQPYVAVDRLDPNVAYVAWSADRLTGVMDRDVFLSRCEFSGVNGTCQAPVRISDNPIADGTAQYFPMMCVDPNNVINVAWNDQRAGGNSTAIYHTEVIPNGAALSVGPSYLTSEVNFTPFNFGGAPDYGDYNENNDACDGEHFYTAWTSHVSPPGILPASNDPDVFFAVMNNLADIRVSGPLDFQVCPGSSQIQELEVFNVGDEFLTVNDVSRASGSTTITVEPNPVVPTTIPPGGHVTFAVRCTPSDFGTDTAVIRIESDDPESPQIDLTASCEADAPVVGTVMANTGDFGDVCLGDFRDLDLLITNDGMCDLDVSGISSSSSEFQLASVMTFPLVVGSADSVAVPVRLAPTSLGAKSSTLTVSSDDPVTPDKMLSVSGNTPPGEIRVTGSGDFGDVCAEDLAEKTFSVCNVGACNLGVTSASIDCPDFTIVDNPFPSDVSHDFCLDLTVQFTPTSPGPKSCTLTILSDDPVTPVVTVDLTANTPLPMIDVPPDVGFMPEVLQDVDVCESALPFPVSNTGSCNLDITSFAVTTGASEYSLAGLPSFPIILEPGHIAGDGDLSVVFGPEVLDRDRGGQLTIEYVSDPVAGTTTTVTRDLCGEGVRTGARVLVTHGGIPLPEVKSIKLHRLGPNRNQDRLDSVDNVHNVPLVIETPDSPCGPFQYHREYGTVSNPVQLAPGSYIVSVMVRIDGQNLKKSVGFDVSSCDFNPTIVVDF